MKLTGIELMNFRSIGTKPVVLSPLNKCNIIIGQNNAGKSNVLKGIKKISDKFQNNGDKVNLDELDLHTRSRNHDFTFKLWFEIDENLSQDLRIADAAKTNQFWFEIKWVTKQQPIVSNNIFAETEDFRQANNLLSTLVGRQWGGHVGQSIIRQEFTKSGDQILRAHFSQGIETVFSIPEFRQIRDGDSYSHDGQSLIKLLSEYQTPPIGKDKDQQKFEKIQDFARQLLHLPNASLEFTRGESKSNLVINNNNLRLPLSSYGTGVHELIIMVTAVLSQDNSLYCIEEPEIHLHPRLQREFIEFLVNKTSNRYLITTHSPTLINSLVTNENITVFFLKNQDGATSGGQILSKKESIDTLKDLGAKPSDLMQANCILWVEGLSARVYLQRWIELLFPDLIEGRDYMFMYYRSLPSLNFETDIFSEELINVMQFNSNAIIVIDSDLNNEHEQIDKVKNKMKTECEENGGLSWITDGREIENYLTPQTIVRACRELRNVDINIQMNPFDEFGEVVDKALKSAKAKPIDYDRAKLNYSRKFAEHIQINDIGEKLREQLDKIILQIRRWND